jgi:uncharacterized membrane protein
VEVKREKALEEPEANSASDTQVPAVPEQVDGPLTTSEPVLKDAAGAAGVHVEPHLSELIAGIHIPLEEAERAREQSRLDQAIHRLLVVGLAVSVAFMLFGLFLDLVLHRVVPTTIPDLREVLIRVVSLRPSGFLALGLLVLIATPVVRVIASFIAFVYERDWRYAGITLVVLLVVILSIVLGKGK